MGKSQVSIGVVLVLLVAVGLISFIGIGSITGFFAGNFTIPFGFTNVTEEICYNDTIKINCYNETTDICTNIFNGTVEICNGTVCEQIPTYEPVCKEEINEVCELENVTICDNFTRAGYDFSTSIKNYTMGDGVFISDFEISPDFGQCDDNYTISMKLFQNESLNFSVSLFMKDATGKSFLIEKADINESTTIDQKKEINFTLSDFCNRSVIYDSELIIYSDVFEELVVEQEDGGEVSEPETPVVSCSEKLDELITYDVETNTIKIIGDGYCFTKDDPATPEDIYQVDQ